ncbi:hypothetical protein M728_000785 [Ensifer sp. WSM1721]|uniref:hypothetical protein n=1 Tax=Ensifer sp. WSM1721 TaxID=1041159 RepID=UPI0004796183|nr:hypothetical protein [Ensifer sp. WSM1721]
MEILSIRPVAGPKDVALYDVEITPHLRLFNVLLRKSPDGRLRSFAPKAFGKHSASFHPELAEQMTQAAIAALGSKAAYDTREI